MDQAQNLNYMHNYSNVDEILSLQCLPSLRRTVRNLSSSICVLYRYVNLRTDFRQRRFCDYMQSRSCSICACVSCCGGLDLLPRFQPVWGTRPMGPTQDMGGRKVSKHRHLFITLFQTTAPKEPTAHHATASTPLHAVIPSISDTQSDVL